MTISDQAQEAVAAVLRSGEKVVDATMGNGWDSLFLAEQVGEEGQLYGFDLQSEAVAKTEKRLQKKGLLERCNLHQSGHETMADWVPSGVGAVMFNLGYLPYGKREVVTRQETTLLALEAAEKLLRPGGIVTVICYRGHPGGLEEACEVWSWFQRSAAQWTGLVPSCYPSGQSAFLITALKKDAR